MSASLSCDRRSRARCSRPTRGPTSPIVARRGVPVWDDAGRCVPRLRRRDRRRRSRPLCTRRRSRRRTRSSTGSGTRRTSTGRSRCCGSRRCSRSGSRAAAPSSATPAPRRTRRRSRSRARRPGRTRIVALEGGFHGRTLGALSATGQPAKWEGFGPLVPGVSFARPNDVESLEAALAPGGETALILLEPVLGEGGVIPLEPAFAQAAAELALEVGALLCVDEVQAGMGRTGTFFAYEQLGIAPDLVTLAKGLANGLPIGALLAGERRRAGLRARRPRLDVRRQPRRRRRGVRGRRGDRRRPARERARARRRSSEQGSPALPARARGSRPRPPARRRARPPRRPRRRRLPRAGPARALGRAGRAPADTAARRRRDARSSEALAILEGVLAP